MKKDHIRKSPVFDFQSVSIFVCEQIWHSYIYNINVHKLNLFNKEQVGLFISIPNYRYGCKWSNQGRVGNPLTDLTQPQFRACPKPELRFPSTYVVVVCIFNNPR